MNLKTLSVLIFAGFVALVVSALALVAYVRADGYSNTPVAAANLRTVGSSQSTFRLNDLDRNAAADYWTDDIAGLHFLKKDGNDLALIPLSIACADLLPREWDQNRWVRSASACHWFRVLIVSDRSTFGACAVPESYGAAGTKVLIINESQTVYKRDPGGDVLTATTPPQWNGRWDSRWPSDLSGWTREDP